MLLLLVSCINAHKFKMMDKNEKTISVPLNSDTSNTLAFVLADNTLKSGLENELRKREFQIHINNRSTDNVRMSKQTSRYELAYTSQRTEMF
jgi:hypothetical protein